MLYRELTVGDNTYKLRLSAKNAISLEEKLGEDPASVLSSGELPSLKKMLTIFHSMLSEYQHGLKFEDACNIFDEYCAEEGNDKTSFFWLLLKTLQNNGYVSKEIDFDALEKGSVEETKKQLEDIDPKN